MTIQMMSRTQMLKDKVISKGCVVFKQEGAHAQIRYRPGVKICLERGRLVTQSYKETEGEPEILRRAKALAKVLENMTLWIQDGELIVGCFASSPNALHIYPDINESMLEDGINDYFVDMLDEEGKKELLEICQYWHGKSITDRIMASLPENVKGYVDVNGVNETARCTEGVGLPTPNHGKLLRVGLNGIIEEIERRLEKLEADTTGLPADDYIEQRHTLEAMKIACEAAIRYAQRYADKAKQMAESEPDATRRKELEKIAEICSWVPANPARTLREALQAWVFSHYINRSIEWQGQSCGDRFDVLFHPFYEADKKRGEITREKAQEMVECVMLKIEDMGRLTARGSVSPGGQLYQNIVIGGTDEEGEDASNEFTLIVIDAAMATRCPQTQLALRYHPRLNPEVISKAIDCMRSGLGYPSVFNDSTAIPYIVNRGIPLRDARNWTPASCVGWTIANKNMRTNLPNAGGISLGKCFELGLNQGKDPFNGKQLGCATPDPKTFTSLEDIWQAYLAQVHFVTDKITTIGNIAEATYARYLPRPYISSLLDGCIEKGKDAARWRYHEPPSILVTGFIDVADSLAAIKKFVFDDKVLSWEDMLAALSNNFEGQEELRQGLINEVPKFGNDDDYVDHIARDVHHRTEYELRKCTSYWEELPYSFDGSIAGGYYQWGRMVGAMPSGKKYREPFADGTISPYPGMDRKGPTAVIKSMGKISMEFPELANQRFMPQFMEGENKRIFADYLRTWADLGNFHIQFNVVDNDTLLDAQAHPENYSDLVVRVAGYSAYFVELSKGVQDEIIKRTAHNF